MSREITADTLTTEAFAPYGDVLDCAGAPDKIINAGLCKRYHDRASLDFGDGRAGISLFHAELRALPYSFSRMERHPDGSQAFLPRSADPFLVIVADDKNGGPGTPRAFLTRAGQGIICTAMSSVQADVDAGRLKLLFRDKGDTGYHVVTRPGVLRPKAKAFVTWLKRQKTV